MTERPPTSDRSPVGEGRSGDGGGPGGGPETAETFGSPEPEVLAGLAPGDWERVVVAARRVLLEHEHAQAKRLRALPTHKLASGRSRRDLCALLAADEDLWREVAGALAADDRGTAVLARIRDGVVPSATEDHRLAARIDALQRRLVELEEREDRLRRRNRALLGERDDARRRADGLAARLETERGRASELEARIAALEREREGLSAQLQEAAAERSAVVERLRRQHDAELEPLRDELRHLRRREEERRLALERRQASAREAEARAAEQIAGYRQRDGGGMGAVRPGRPSRLPPDVDATGSDAAEALIAGGRRVLIDGYNVTKQHRGQAPLEQQRRWLVGTCETLAARTGAHITIVFDGQEGVGRATAGGRRVHVRFSLGGSADDVLVRMVAALPVDEPVVVVTDDRELRERLGRYRVDLIRTAAFVAVAE